MQPASQTADLSGELSVLPAAVPSNFSSRKGPEKEVVEGRHQGARGLKILTTVKKLRSSTSDRTRT